MVVLSGLFVVPGRFLRKEVSDGCHAVVKLFFPALRGQELPSLTVANPVPFYGYRAFG
jgi:hypothetical protein